MCIGQFSKDFVGYAVPKLENWSKQLQSGGDFSKFTFKYELFVEDMSYIVVITQYASYIRILFIQ